MITFTLIILGVGLLLFLAGDKIHPDIKELGRLMFLTAMAALLFGH